MYKDHYSGNVCSVYFKQGKVSEKQKNKKWKKKNVICLFFI